MKNTDNQNRSIWTYIKNYKLNSMFFRSFLIVFALFSIPFLMFSIMYYNNLKNATYQDIEKENTSLVYEIRDLTDSVFSQCDSLATYIANNVQTQMFALNRIYTGTENLNSFSNLIQALPLIFDHIDSIYVYSGAADTVFSADGKISQSDQFADNTWLSAAKTVKDRRGTMIARLKNGTYPMLITIVKPILLENDVIGSVILNINAKELLKGMSVNRGARNGQNIFIVSAEGQIYSSDKQDYFMKYTNEIPTLKDFESFDNLDVKRYMADGEKNIISAKKSEFMPLYYISVKSMEFYKERLESMVWQIVWLAVILILMSGAVAYFTAATGYRPVAQIISVLEHPEKYSAQGRESQNELKYIITNIMKNIELNEQMQTELETRLELLKTAQIAMLQMQINPHFLYNTLDTIKWMALDLTGDDNNVSEAVGSLAKLYRLNVNTGDYLISLKEEMEQAKNYINILMLRYEDLFKVVWDIDEDALSCTVLRLSMQPVIENAVYHGLKPMRKNGVLTVRGFRADGKVAVVIQDNGVGIPKDELEKLNRELSENPVTPDESGHIGIYNVNRRIKLIYGENYGVFVSSEENKGTIVRLIFPETYI